ncbi:hypothetical protein BRARA_I05363 [Brassica rapa]|uniref:Leucine-rich repeat-containing N-terminal plant-type domain-containing protein n=1 Tax=Brassica campestris TaxID=3711 RepID=A0A397Y7W4_BRACM|nr:hypothetical protein BRARA_I05363 [Brassica rapa]
MRTYERYWWWVKEKKQMALVLFMIVTLMLQLQMKGCVGCLETERMGLLQLKSYLKNGFEVEEEGMMKSWSHDDPSSDCCHWKRVKCSDATGGHVVHLSLNGLIPVNYEFKDQSLNLSLLHSFPQLQSLDFAFSHFSDLFDPINGHKSFQKLEKLRTLDFYYNRLNNSVFTFLSEARSLRTLNVSHNLLDGVFPPNVSIMTKLKTLDLSYNELSDASQIKGKSSSRNDTCGVAVLKDMPMLQELDLSDNRFTDLDRLGVLLPSSLHVLNLAKNQLSSIPKGYLEICALMNLRELNLRSNALTNLPYCLGNLSSIRTLDLSENQMNGDLSSFVSDLPSTLEYLSLFDNDFNGSFWFSSLANHTRLTVFKLSSNLGMIQAQAESSWLPPFQLKILKLKNFNLGSTIPSFLAHQHDLRFIHISYSQLKGPFPGWLVQNNTRLEAIRLNNNFLGVFNISYNDLSGEIPFKAHLMTFDEKSYRGNPHLCGRPTNKSCNLERASVSNRAKEEEEGDGVIDMVWFYWTCGAVYISTWLALFAFLCIDSRWSSEWFYHVDLVVHHLQRFKDGCN